MANTANVRVAITGQVASAPLGTTLPTTPTEALDSAFEVLGFVSEDGVTPNFEDSINKIKAWQGAQIVRTIVTEESINFSMSLIETSYEVLTRFFPGATIDNPSAGVYRVRIGQRTPDPRVWVIDVIDGSVLWRYVLPRAELTERGEVPHTNDDAVGWPIMIEALPDPTDNYRVDILSNQSAWGYASA